MSSEGSDLIEVFIHWWINNWMTLLGDGGNCRREGLAGGSRSLGCALEGQILSLTASSCSLLLGCHELSSSNWLHSLPCCSPSPQARAMEPTDYRLKSLKPRARINLSSNKLISSGICHSDEELTNIFTQCHGSKTQPTGSIWAVITMSDLFCFLILNLGPSWGWEFYSMFC